MLRVVFRRAIESPIQTGSPGLIHRARIDRRRFRRQRRVHLSDALIGIVGEGRVELGQVPRVLQRRQDIGGSEAFAQVRSIEIEVLGQLPGQIRVARLLHDHEASAAPG